MTDLHKALTQEEKPPVKSYCGGKPNYCTPEVTPDVDAVNMSQERVDKTAKRKRKWKWLTPDEQYEIHFSNNQNPYDVCNYIRYIEKQIRKKNT